MKNHVTNVATHFKGKVVVVGRGQRGVRRERRAPLRLAAPAEARRRVHRDGVPDRAGRGPERQAVHQRLQHRRHQRQEHRDLQPGQGLQGPRRADRLRRVPVPPDHRAGPLDHAAEPAAVRRPRRGRADHRARHPHDDAVGRHQAGHAGGRLQEGLPDLPRGQPLPGRDHLGHHRQVLVGPRRLPRPGRRAGLGRQLRQEAGLRRDRLGLRRHHPDDPARHADAPGHADADGHPDRHADAHGHPDHAAGRLPGDLRRQPVEHRLHRERHGEEHVVERDQRLDADVQLPVRARPSPRRGAR